MDRKSSAVDTVTVAVSRIIGSLTMDDIYALLLYLVFRETLSVSHSNKHPIYLSAQNHYWCWDSIENQ